MILPDPIFMLCHIKTGEEISNRSLMLSFVKAMKDPKSLKSDASIRVKTIGEVKKVSMKVLSNLKIVLL